MSWIDAGGATPDTDCTSRLPLFSRLYRETFEQSFTNSHRGGPNLECISSPLHHDTPRIASPKIIPAGAFTTAHASPSRDFSDKTQLSTHRSNASNSSTKNTDQWKTSAHHHPSIALDDRSTSTRTNNSHPDRNNKYPPSDSQSQLSVELDRYRNLYRMKVQMESQKDENIAALQRQIALLNQQKESNIPSHSPPFSGKIDLDSTPEFNNTAELNRQQKSKQKSPVWDLGGLIDNLGARSWGGSRKLKGYKTEEQNVINGIDDVGSKDLEIQKLKDVVAHRSRQILLLQSQLEDMEKYLNSEREAFQSEVESRNRLLADVREEWEKDKANCASLMQQKFDLTRQLEEKISELERRENWVKDLTARVRRLETHVSALEEELEERKSEVAKLKNGKERLQQIVDAHESSIRCYRAFRMSSTTGQMKPVCIIFQESVRVGSYWMQIQTWNEREAYNFIDIIEARMVDVGALSDLVQEKRRFRFTGHMTKWIEASFSTKQTRRGGQYPLRGGFRADYAFDENGSISSGSNKSQKGLSISTYSGISILLSFPDELILEDVVRVFNDYHEKSRVRETELKNKQKTICLGTLESLFYGFSNATAIDFPPVREI